MPRIGWWWLYWAPSLFSTLACCWWAVMIMSATLLPFSKPHFNSEIAESPMFAVMSVAITSVKYFLPQTAAIFCDSLNSLVYSFISEDFNKCKQMSFHIYFIDTFTDIALRRYIIPVPRWRGRNTRNSTYSHLFQVSLPNAPILFQKSFILRMCHLWNHLPSSFPRSYI